MIALLVILFLGVSRGFGIEIFAEWTSLNFTWDSSHKYSEYLSTNQYIPTNCVLAGIKVDLHQNIYVTVPRWREGVPATLNKLKLVNNEYILSPYPSWDMQTIGIPGQLQNCQSMAIDSSGLMFVIEVGRRNFYDLNPLKTVNGIPGVWIINTETSEIISQYYFPSSVASPNSSFVNDIVLDETKNIAYLTDAWGSGGLIIYNYGLSTSRRYSGASTANNPSYVMIINGVNYGTNQFTTPIDGIAISDDLKAIFYCGVQDTYLYRLPTEILNDFTLTNDEITAAVEQLPGVKEPSDGIMFWNGILYYGSLPESTYYALKISSTSSPDVSTKSVPVWPDQVNMRWLDTFSLDPSDPSKLWAVSNSLDLYFTNGYSATEPNMRIITTTATDVHGSGAEDDDNTEKQLKIYRIVMIVFIVLSVVLAVAVAYLYTSATAKDGSLIP